jgi:hypothetical protein
MYCHLPCHSPLRMFRYRLCADDAMFCDVLPFAIAVPCPACSATGPVPMTRCFAMSCCVLLPVPFVICWHELVRALRRRQARKHTTKICRYATYIVGIDGALPSSFLNKGCRASLAVSCFSFPTRLGVTTLPRAHEPLIPDREALRASAHSLCSL